MDSYSPYTNAKLTSLDPNHLAPTVAVRDPTPERRRTALIACVAVACMVGSFCVGHTVATQSLVGSTSEATTAPKFAPNTRFNPPTRTTLNAARGLTEPNFGNDGEFDILSQPGIIEPTGFFDPLKLTKGKSEARLKYFREAEIKHGRVAMLAALGFLVGESFHPLFGGNIDSPSYLAFQQTPLETFWPGVVAAIGVLETSAIRTFKNPKEAMWTLRDDYINGDLGFDPAVIKPKDPEALEEMQTKEIQNGRLAMLGIAGMVAQELVDGNPLLGVPQAQAAEIVAIAQDMSAHLNM